MAGFGAYGKIPSLGDFFRINISSDFVRPWDQWLQGGVSTVRTILGDDWKKFYMSAPIWRFTLSGGLAGRSGRMGVLMPSVDRVGRVFPLTLVAPIASPSDISSSHFAATSTFEALERIALDALEDDMTPEILGAQLRDISGESGAHAPPAKGSTQEVYSASIWSASLEGTTPVLRCSALPNGDEMEGLFNLEAAVWKSTGQTIGALT